MKFLTVYIRVSSKEARLLNKIKYPNHRSRWDEMAATQPIELHPVGSDLYLDLNTKVHSWNKLS